MKSFILSLLVIAGASVATAHDKTCMEPCASPGDFPYYSGNSTGLSTSFDLKISTLQIPADAKVSYSLVIDWNEHPMTPGALVTLSPTQQLITIRTINYAYDKGYRRPDDIGWMGLRVSMISKGQLIATEMIPFAVWDVKKQFFVDEPRLFKIGPENMKAQLEFELIAAGGMKCRWYQLPGGTICQ